MQSLSTAMLSFACALLLGCAELLGADTWSAGGGGAGGGGAGGGSGGEGGAVVFHALWSRRFGDEAKQYTWGVALDAQGRSFLSGSFEGSIDLDDPPLYSQAALDAYVAKFDDLGEPVWSKGLPDVGTQVDQATYGLAAVPEDGGVVAVGTFEGSLDLLGSPQTSAGETDVFLARLRADGTRIWGKAFGGPGTDAGFSVAVNPGDGAIAITGDAQPNSDFGAGPILIASESTAFLAVYDASGTHRWSLALDGPGKQSGNAVGFGPGGSVYLAGSFLGVTDFGDGTMIDSGATESTFVAKYDSTGKLVWVRALSAAVGTDFPMVVDAEGDPLVVGDFEGTLSLGGQQYVSDGKDGFVAKLAASDGAARWVRTFGGSGSQVATAVAVGLAGEVFVAGSFETTLDFWDTQPWTTTAPSALFIIRFDSAGARLWDAAYDDAETSAAPTAIAVDTNGDIILSGDLWASLDLGAGTLTSAGQADGFLAKLGRSK